MRIHPMVFQRLALVTTLAFWGVTTSADVTLNQSPNDGVAYLALVLPNKMKVVLVSDPKTDKSAAALSVAVGAGNDPQDRQGIAHLLEHMLFLGTQKYPAAEEYQEFIRANGGTHNAFTSYEFTTYFFDINSSLLDPALDRFSQFFTAPLFTPKYVDRERNAVESEYRARMKDDARRRFYVQKDVTNPRHPFSFFQSGSLETLSDNGEHTIRDDLLDFYAKNYSANLMTLAVMGKEPLEELKAMVSERFSAVPNIDAARLHVTEPLFESGRLPTRVDMIPNKEQRGLHMVFPITSMREHYLSKPTEFLGHLLGHEGKGSLLSLLKDKGWANSLSAGGGSSAPGNATFSVSVTLTEDGLANIDGIVAHIFEQLHQIRRSGINEWAFEEQKKLNDLAFRFMEKPEPSNRVMNIAASLHVFPMRDVLRGPYALELYKPELINEVLDHLTPDNVLITVVAKNQPTDRVTRWFETPYAVVPIDQATLTKWHVESSDERLLLPSPNPFIPENLELKPIAENTPIPTKTEQLTALDLWFKQENRFGTPRADFFVSIRAELAKNTPNHSVMTNLFIALVNDQLNEFSYPAILAGLSYRLYPHARGFSIRISGYNDKQELLLKRLIDTLHDPQIDTERFAIIKERQLRRLRSAQLDRPYSQAMSELSKLLVERSWTEDQQIAALEVLTADELRAFIPTLLGNISVVALGHGNLLRQDAMRLANVVKEVLLDGVPRAPVPISRVVKLAPGSSLVRELDVDHSDSVMALYFQSDDKSMRSRAHTSLLVQILSSPYHAILRTEKQLGYIVFATRATMLEIPAVSFVIQSPVADPAQLLTHTESFLNSQVDNLREMSDEQFGAHRNGLLTKILDEEKTLVEVSDRYWTEIDRHHYRFDSRDRLADAVRATSKDALVEFYKQLLLSESRKELLIRTVGNNHRDTFVPDDAKATLIPNTERFQDDKAFFPPPTSGSG